MSFVNAAPGIVTNAAADVAGIGSKLSEATAAAAAPTIEVASAAADEVSGAVSRLFGAYGQDFSDIAARMGVFQQQFVNLLHSSADAYANAEAGATSLLGSAANPASAFAAVEPIAKSVGNSLSAPVQSLLSATPVGDTVAGVGQSVKGAVTALRSGGAGALVSALPALAQATPPGVGGAYQQLFSNTVANLQSLGNTWAADPAPFLRQIIANQQGFAQQFAAEVATFVQNFPTSLARSVQSAIQSILAFDPVAFVRELMSTQAAYQRIIHASLSAAGQHFAAGLSALPDAFQSAYQQLTAGNIKGAVDILGTALTNLVYTGFDVVQNPDLSFSITPTGVAGDLFPVFAIPGDALQNLTNSWPSSSIAGQLSQNFTNVINTLTDTSITASIGADLSTTFGVPLALGLQALGGPVAGLSAAGTSMTAFVDAVEAGNVPAAVGALIDAPAVIANGYLNGETTIPLSLDVLGIPVELDLPFDGILVPQGTYTGTLFGFLPVTISGTALGGIVPALVNYLPQQLATAITPVA